MAIEILHRDLIRVGDSDHKSECPSCGEDGLHMRRDGSGFLLQNDVCFNCGEQFIYIDIKPLSRTIQYQEAS